MILYVAGAKVNQDTLEHPAVSYVVPEYQPESSPPDTLWCFKVYWVAGHNIILAWNSTLNALDGSPITRKRIKRLLSWPLNYKFRESPIQRLIKSDHWITGSGNPLFFFFRPFILEVWYIWCVPFVPATMDTGHHTITSITNLAVSAANPTSYRPLNRIDKIFWVMAPLLMGRRYKSQERHKARFGNHWRCERCWFLCPVFPLEWTSFRERRWLRLRIVDVGVPLDPLHRHLAFWAGTETHVKCWWWHSQPRKEAAPLSAGWPHYSTMAWPRWTRYKILYETPYLISFRKL